MESVWDRWLESALKSARLEFLTTKNIELLDQCIHKKVELEQHFNPYQIIPMQGFGFSREENIENSLFYPKPLDPHPPASGNWNPKYHYNPKEGSHL